MAWIVACLALPSFPVGVRAQSSHVDIASSSEIEQEVLELDGLLHTGEESPVGASFHSQTDVGSSGELEVCEPGCLPGVCYSRRHHGIWLRVDSLLWWSSGITPPALVTTSPIGTPPGDAGIVDGDTTVLTRGSGLLDDARSGGRLAVAKWLGCERLVAVEGVLTALSETASSWTVDSDTYPILARPYYDLLTDANAASLVAYPGMMTGDVRIDASSQFLAAEALLRMIFAELGEARLDLLAGYRYQRFDESLTISQSSFWTEAQGPILAGTSREVQDSFDTRTRFDGIEVGLMYEACFWRCSLGMTTKVAFGRNRSWLGIDGATVTTVPGAAPATFEGGMLAQPTNMGHYTWDEFAVVPELGVCLKCDLTDRLRAVLGYSLNYWYDVTRPANQIDLALSQLPPDAPTGANRPAALFGTSDYWLQGMRLGLELDF